MSDLAQEIGVAPEPIRLERIGVIERNTTETKISMRLNVDGQGTYEVSTGIRFFDHMLELFTRHRWFRSETQMRWRFGCRSTPHR